MKNRLAMICLGIALVLIATLARSQQSARVVRDQRALSSIQAALTAMVGPASSVITDYSIKGTTYGVVGQSTGGTSDLATVGVYGSTANASKGQGIYGVNTSASDEGATVATGAAIWADTSTANVALLATAR